MDFEWVAIGLGDVAWIALAFVFGLLARTAGLPPLVGFLATGFLLGSQGVSDDQFLNKLADISITLLLFTVGLKLNLQMLARPQVWAVTGIHMSITVGVFGAAIYGLSVAGVWIFADLDLHASLLVAFALSFSSTVFVVKVLEERGEMTSLHGRIAIGILLMQDVAAVTFLAISKGEIPSVWAVLLLALILMRPLLQRILQRIGHGELLVLFGFLLALGGAEVFELVGLKGDLGALVLGVLIASQPKAEELAKAMLSLKDLFLLAFFLSIGLSGQLSLDVFLIAAMITPFVLLKSVLFFTVLTRFKLRARTSLLASINLSNYSEFGLIVAAIGVANGWINNQWLIVIAISLSFSFVIASALSAVAEKLYTRHRAVWRHFQKAHLIDDDQLLDLGGATIAVIGMGGVGTGAYDALRQQHGETVVGIDIDPVTARSQQATGRQVLRGDASDADFWDRVQASHTLQLVMLSLPKQSTTLDVLDRLRAVAFPGQVAVAARFQDQVEPLQRAGATTVYNMYAEAGAGFVAHVADELPRFRGDRSDAK